MPIEVKYRKPSGELIVVRKMIKERSEARDLASMIKALHPGSRVFINERKPVSYVPIPKPKKQRVIKTRIKRVPKVPKPRRPSFSELMEVRRINILVKILSLPKRQYSKLELYRLLKLDVTYQTFSNDINALLKLGRLSSKMIGVINIKRLRRNWIIANMPGDKKYSIRELYELLKPRVTFRTFQDDIRYLTRRKLIDSKMILKDFTTINRRVMNRRERIINKMVRGRTYRIGDLYKALRLGVSYRNFQRDIAELADEKKIVVRKVFGGRTGTTTFIRRTK